MPPRAFIIAIEDYPVATSLANPLKDTNKSAKAYFDWITTRKQIQPGDVWVCGGNSLSLPGVRKFGSTRADVVRAVQDLTSVGRDTTPELYCFISTHGFCYATRTAMDPMDVIVCSDFVDPSQGGTACFLLQELQQKLGRWLGGITHYYFSDACRTELAQDQIDPVSLGLTLGMARAGIPVVSSLFSTASGNPAAVDSGFAQVLCDGLGGRGHAKGWVNGTEMWVMFALLSDFVSHAVPGQAVSFVPGGGSGKIYKLPQVPVNTCQITVRNALPTDTFSAELLLHGLSAVKQTFAGPTCTMQAPPEIYSLSVMHRAAAVVQINPPANQGIDLFESASVLLEKRIGVPMAAPPPGPPPAGPPGAAVPPPPAPPAVPPSLRAAPAGGNARLNVELPPNTSVRLQSLDSGTTADFQNSFSSKVAPGLYRLDLMEAGRSIRSRMLRIGDGDSIISDLRTERPTRTHSSILSAVPGQHGEGRVDFSEQLGSIADADLGLWLAILGASRILAPPSQFSKLEALPLETFRSFEKGSSSVYLLVGLDEVPGTLRTAVSDAFGRENWQAARQVPGMKGIYDLRLDVTPGAHYLSIDLPNALLLTIPIVCFANRITLVTLSRDAQTQGRDPSARDRKRYLRHLRLYQHVLPFYGVTAPGDAIRAKMNLKTLRSLYIIEAAYCQRQTIAKIENLDVQKEWGDILAGNWLDPLSAVIGCYELYRNGKASMAGDGVKNIVGKLRKSYPGIPDTEAISSLMGFSYQRPATPPLFLDGFLVFSGEEESLKLPSNKIDYNSPWTEWKGAYLNEKGTVVKQPEAAMTR